MDSSADITYDLITDASLDEAKEISRNNSDYGLLYITDFDTPEEIAESIVFISEAVHCFLNDSLKVLLKIQGRVQSMAKKI